MKTVLLSPRCQVEPRACPGFLFTFPGSRGSRSSSARRRWLGSAVLAGVLFFLARPLLAATPFVHETVDAAGGVGLTSLALDSQSRPHISYLNEDTGGLHYAKKSGGVWARETVDAAGAGTFSNSLALDAEGNPRITYEEAGQLKYASKSGAVWTVETVDSGGLGAGVYSSLALDAQGNPRISYLKLIGFGSVHLKYATKSSGIWITETVDATGDMFSSTSLALDALGNPHIAYHNQGPGDLKYAKKSGVSWSIETVDAAGHVGDHPSLALDAQGNPRISYWIDVAADLKFAAKSGDAAWSIEVVDASAGDVGFGSSLGLDAQGNPRIAYNEYSSSDLKYATKSSGGWTLETVEINGGRNRSLALDAQGNPCISYSDGDLKFTDSAVHVLSPLGGERWAAGSLKTVRWSGAGTVSIQLSSDGGLTYSTLLSSISAHEVTITVPVLTSEEARVRINRSSPISTSDSPRYFSIAPDLVSPWWSETVGAGDVSSLALDARGKPHVSFNDAVSGHLRYASRSGGAWTLETVDDVAGLSSLKLDSEGNPRISYDDIANGNLMYAAKSGGAWTVESVDGGGEYCSLALDAQGNPAISHYHLFLGDLKYARKSGGVWTLETVDATGDVGWYSSLALDAQGNPCISYYFVTLGDLKYASKSGGDLDPRDRRRRRQRRRRDLARPRRSGQPFDQLLRRHERQPQVREQGRRSVDARDRRRRGGCGRVHVALPRRRGQPLDQLLR